MTSFDGEWYWPNPKRKHKHVRSEEAETLDVIVQQLNKISTLLSNIEHAQKYAGAELDMQTRILKHLPQHWFVDGSGDSPFEVSQDRRLK